MNDIKLPPMPENFAWALVNDKLKAAIEAYAIKAITQDRQSRGEPMAWQDIDDHAPPRDCLYMEEDKTVGRRLLVTNNIHSETSTGQMSHVWLATPIWDKSKKWWVAFDSNDNKIEGITHWFDPLNPAPNPANPTVKDSLTTAEPVKEPSDEKLYKCAQKLLHLTVFELANNRHKEPWESAIAELETALASYGNAAQPAASAEPIKILESVREYLREGIENATGCEDSDVDHEFAHQLGVLLGPIYSFMPIPAVTDHWSPLTALAAAPVAAQPSVPEIMTDTQYHQQYISGWNQCRAAMLRVATPADRKGDKQ